MIIICKKSFKSRVQILVKIMLKKLITQRTNGFISSYKFDTSHIYIVIYIYIYSYHNAAQYILFDTSHIYSYHNAAQYILFKYEDIYTIDIKL